MQEFQTQRTEDFLVLVGGLLADSVAEQQTPQQQQAVQKLGDYIQTARVFHGISSRALAQRIDLTEADIYALEHGLLPYARLTRPLLQRMAIACHEDEDILVALLSSAQCHVTPLEREKKPQVQHDSSIATRAALLFESGQILHKKMLPAPLQGW